jgi:hypothetical protein
MEECRNKIKWTSFLFLSLLSLWVIYV